MVAWRLKLAMKVTNMLPVVVSTTKFATDFLVKVLKDGDLIKVDMCVDLKGAISDSCWSYVVGESTPEIDRLMEVTKKRYILGLNKHK